MTTAHSLEYCSIPTRTTRDPEVTYIPTYVKDNIIKQKSRACSFATWRLYSSQIHFGDDSDNREYVRGKWDRTGGEEDLKQLSLLEGDGGLKDEKGGGCKRERPEGCKKEKKQLVAMKIYIYKFDPYKWKLASSFGCIVIIRVHTIMLG